MDSSRAPSRSPPRCLAVLAGLGPRRLPLLLRAALLCALSACFLLPAGRTAAAPAPAPAPRAERADGPSAKSAAGPAVSEPAIAPAPIAPAPTAAPAPAPAPAVSAPAASPQASSPAKPAGPAAPGLAGHGDVLLRTVIGLMILLVLAYIGGHPRVQRVEEWLGLSQVITAGFPFVLLGYVARRPEVGVLTDRVLSELTPLLRLGLGWIGITIGFRVDLHAFEGESKSDARLIVTRAITSFAIIVAGCSAVLVIEPMRLLELKLASTVLRDALLLGIAGTLTSLYTPQLLRARGGDEQSIQVVSRVTRWQEVLGIVGMLFIAAYFRPIVDDAAWRVPETVWLLLTLGLGSTIGILVYIIHLRNTAGSGEEMVLLLGSVAFAAGMASNLHLPPVVVCFVVGFLLANLPGHYRDRVRQTLHRLERPIYLLFLLIVGAELQITDRRGWVLMAAFVVARLVGNALGTRLGERAARLQLSPSARGALFASPLSALSIALVVSARLLYTQSDQSGALPQLITAIVGGSITTEVLAQILTRLAARRLARVAPAPAPAPQPATAPPDSPPPTGGAA